MSFSRAIMYSWKVTYDASHTPIYGVSCVLQRDTSSSNSFGMKDRHAMDGLPWRATSIFFMARSSLFRTAERVQLPAFVTSDH